MQRIATLLARLLALLFAFLFVLSSTVVVFAFAAYWQFLRPDPYKQALLEVNAYERAPGILAEAITVADAEPQAAIFVNLEQADYEILLRHVVPLDWLQSETESVIDQIFAGLRSPQASPSLTVSLVALKQRLESEAAATALLEIVERRPPCPEGALSALTCGFELSGAISCRPPSLQLQICGALVNTAFDATAAALPDQVTLSNLLQTGSPLLAILRQALGPYPALVGNVVRFGWIAPVLLLLLITLFGVRSLPGLLRWWGLPIVGVGLLLLLLALFTWLVPTWFFQSLIRNVQTVAPTLATFIIDVVSVLGRRLALLLGVAAVFSALGGLIFLLFSFLVPAPRKT